MKRYLFFPTYQSDWFLEPQYVLCGSPRTATLSPVSNATTYLWEQIEPNPLTDPVTIIPNNTSKNVIIIIPNNIQSNIRLRVTLNGDTNNYKFVDIVPLLVDNINNFSKGGSLLAYNNTLNDPITITLAPYPPDGPQVIQYTNNNQTTGIRLNSVNYTYRNTFAQFIDVIDSNNNTTSVSVFKSITDLTTPDTRLNLNVNTNYTFIKRWLDIKVLSQELESSNQQILMSYPNYIADEYAKTFNKGASLLTFNRVPFTVQNIFNLEDISSSSNFNKGGSLLSFNRVPFTLQNLSDNNDNISSSIFNKGASYLSFNRIPFTSTIIG